MRVSEKAARNFIRNRGRANLRILLELLQQNRSGQEIAKVLGVSRERVRQWRNLFGQTITLFQPYPEVLKSLR
jgi:hypothetical protein